MEFTEANTMRAAKPPKSKMLKSLEHIIEVWQQHSGGQSLTNPAQMWTVKLACFVAETDEADNLLFWA